MPEPGPGPGAGTGPGPGAGAGPGPGPEPESEPDREPEQQAEAAQESLSGAALTVFRLNGQFLSVAERLARPAGLTAAWWQVLGAVLPGPLPVAGIARTMGVTRQSVQRIADLLVEQGLAEYRPNPAHRRAKLVAVTGEGREAVRRIDPAHAAYAVELCRALGGPEEFAATVAALRRLSAALDRVAPPD